MAGSIGSKPGELSNVASSMDKPGAFQSRQSKKCTSLEANPGPKPLNTAASWTEEGGSKNICFPNSTSRYQPLNPQIQYQEPTDPAVMDYIQALSLSLTLYANSKSNR
jgi:hypothetical protein